MAKKICPGIIAPMGHPMMVSVVKKSIRPSPVHKDLLEIEYLDGWRKNLNVTKGAKKVSLYKHTVFLFPHGNEKCMAYPEATEAVLQITDKVFPGLFMEVRKANEAKWEVIRENVKMNEKIKKLEAEKEKLQDQLARK